tara:strand:+ start:192 stop:428 length:237 start_codon:yes stop_codon:yes gene_type:complete
MVFLFTKDIRYIGFALGIGLGILLRKQDKNKQEDILCKQKYNKTSFCFPSRCSGSICTQDCGGNRPANHYNNWKKNNC